MSQDDDSVRRQINLAEFAALRAEIDNRANLSWNIFALQLTAAGVIFSFALSNPNHTGFLLILPLTTYAFTGRYLSQYLGNDNIGTYIREVLNPKMNGELLWEDWHNGRTARGPKALTWLNPLIIAFPGVATIALIWVAPYVWASANTYAAKRILIVAIWLLGILVTALSFQLIIRIVSRHWGRLGLNRARLKEDQAERKPDSPPSPPTAPRSPTREGNLPGTNAQGQPPGSSPAKHGTADDQ
jgi:hypothetical protein